MGYLGKISAVVTANTVDFSRNLNGAAADLKRFAGAVERDITRATNDANKAFSSMLTPLQRLERALQAASSMKLSFRGFAGAIRDIDGLKQRLATLKNSQVGLVVRASGMRSINEFRAAIEGIEGRSLDLAVRFGGLEQLRTIRSELANLSQQSVAAVTADPGGLARLKELQETVRALAGDPLRLALRVGGAEALDKVEEQATGLSRKDLRLLMRIGGVEQLDRVVEELDRYDSPTINALVKFGGLAELDQALEQFRNATPEQINAVINVLGTQDIEDATNRVRALASAAKLVAEPIGRATQTIVGLGLDVEQAFAKAQSTISNAAGRLKSDIESGTKIGESRFIALANAARRFEEAADRAAEASQAIGGFNPGTSLGFISPEALRAINRAREVQQQSLTLSPESIRRGQFGFRSQQIGDELRVLEQRLAERDALVAAGPADGRLGRQRYLADLKAAEDSLTRQVAKLQTLVGIYDKVRAAAAVFETEVAALAPRGQLPAEQLASARQRAQDAVASTSDIGLRTRLERQLAASRRFIQRDADRLAGLPIDDPRVVDSLARSQQRFERIAAAAAPPEPPQPPTLQLTRADIGLNAPLTDSTRQIGVLIGQVNSLESALEGLPISVRVGFVPALEAAKNELLALRNNADATAEEIAAAEARVRGEQGRVRNAVSVQGIRDQFGDFDEFINAGRIRAAGGELEVLRGILGRVGAQASGPAVQAFNRFRDAVALSLENPGNAELSAAVDQARNEAITAASQIRGAGSQRRIRGQLQRAGDIQRFGADNISLALQQAAFAVDDFFSVQGDFSQRIRAVQNNLTQLAFILGGTTGLFIGLGVAIAAQAGIAIVKWINNGRTAEDQTKALNESLARQKTLVEELAGAFASLGDSIAERAFSEPAQQARAFRKELQDIAKKQEELRNEDVAVLDAVVQRERGDQNRIQRDLENESDAGRRVALLEQLQASRRREEARILELSRQAAPDRQQLERTVLGTIRANEFLVGGRMTAESERLAQARRDRVAADFANANDPFEQARIIRERIAERNETASQPIGVFNFDQAAEIVRARSDVANLQADLASLELPLKKALDDAAINLTVTSNDASIQIEQAQNAVADAIRAGVPGARLVEQRLNSLGSQLERAFIDLEAAQRVTDVDERTRLQEEAGRRIADVAARQEAEVARADAIRREQTVDPQRTLEARIQRAQQNLQGAGLADGQIARRLREIEFERETLRQQAQRLPNDPVFARAADQADAALRQEAAALEAATLAVNRFSEALNRASQEAQQNLQSAQQAADQARRDDLGFSTPRTRDERAAAEAALQRQIELESQAQVEIANARARLEEQAQNDPALQATFQRIRDITEQLASGALSADQQAALRQERAALQASIDQQVQLDPAVQAARDASTQEEEQRQAAARGRRLALTPSQQAAEDLARGIEDIRQAFGQAAVEGTGLVDVQAQQEAINRLVSERARQTAPAIFGLADSVQNAVLQGPSRAALNVSDISTQEGARELNRLLRGDDPARDQNLLELQRQSQALDDLNAKVAALGARVGVA